MQRYIVYIYVFNDNIQAITYLNSYLTSYTKVSHTLSTLRV